MEPHAGAYVAAVSQSVVPKGVLPLWRACMRTRRRQAVFPRVQGLRRCLVAGEVTNRPRGHPECGTRPRMSKRCSRFRCAA